MNTLFSSIIRALTLQLALLLVALPIFICSGLPLSIASSIGTLIFSPFLTLFLLLSSLLFFSELLCIPNEIICTAIEYTTNIWTFFLSFSSQQWLIGFARPPIIILPLVPLTTLFVITHKKLQTPYKRISALMFIFLFVALSLKIYPYTRTPYIAPIECGKKNLHIITHPGQTIVIDPSALAAKASPDGWINFTLTSELIKNTGSLHIDHFILRTVSNRTLQTLEKILSNCSVRHIHLPFHPTITTKDNPLFQQLQRVVTKRGGTITCIENTHECVIDLSLQMYIKRVGGTSSPRLQIKTVINNTTHLY